MKINEKNKLKTKAKTLILILLITLSMASIININGNLPRANREEEKVNVSSPIDTIYRYNYENDFEYYWHTASLEGGFPVKFVEGYNTEWSQDPNDSNILKLIFGCTFLLLTNMAGNLYVVSQNEFERTLNSELGAYIDWKIKLDTYFMLGSGINAITLSLLIYTPTEEFDVIFYHTSLTDLNTQQGQLYVPNFDKYIWNDGKIRFVLSAAIIGSSPAVGQLVMSLNFEGLRVVQELYPHEPEAEKRTLILVHGWSIWGDPTPDSFWQLFGGLYAIYGQYDRYTRFYDGNIHIIHYYGVFMGEECTTRTPIERVAELLASYIITHFETITDNVDFICHSMGGLVVRYMIKHFYMSIKLFYNATLGRDFNIRNVCTIATPNHGVWYGWAGRILLNLQGEQMMAFPFPSPFLLALNAPPETPYSDLINWFTYAGAKYIFADGIVEVISVPLIGATNRGLYPLDHSEMITEFCVNVVVFNDIYKPPALIQNIFLENEPGKQILIKDLIVEPDPDTPGEISLTITLPIEDVISIYPTTVTIQVSANNYLMTLKEGTTDTFEVKLPLGEGYYSFLISAQERDGGLYRIWGNLNIPDDDVKPPEIQITPEDLSISDEQAGEGVVISWEISDYSGISEAIVRVNGIEIASYGQTEGTIIDSYFLPNILGEYTISIWARDNDDDPEHDPPGEDWSECTIEKTFIIYDDDDSPPTIEYFYTGDGTDGNPGEIVITASDESGLSVDPSGTYSVPNSLGTYYFEFYATDNDNDRPDDSLTSRVSISITIYDDDTTPPQGEINYIGDGLDSNPGYFEWHVWDVDSGLSELEVKITYNSTDSSENFEIMFNGTSTGKWDIPSNLGYYTIFIFARDNDDDRTLLVDSLTIEVSTDQEIIDDDFDPPELSNLLIIPDLFEINITFDAIDESGIGDISILINGELVEPLTQIQYGSTYSFIFENQWIFERGICEVTIQVEDGDDDRPNDALTSSITGTFQNALIQMYEYVDWQIGELKAYIDENLSCRKGRCLNWKLSKAQEYLAEAFNLLENGKITCALYHDKMAKVFVQLAELRAEICNKHCNKHCNRHCHISDDHIEYITDALQTIRNNIVILMGASTGSEQAYDIAYIEVDLLNLSDFIEEEVPCCTGKYLSRKVECASKLLEMALFKIAMDKDIECLLRCAQWKLKHVICKINWYLHKGRISEDLANYLIDEITRIIEAIEQIITGPMIDTTPPDISITYEGAGYDNDPGVWHVFIEDLESGLDEVQILVDGNIYIHDQGLNGEFSKSYEIDVPGSPGNHTITVIAKNDIDFDGVQEVSTEELTTRIDEYIPPM